MTTLYKNLSKNQVATAIALFFHAIGLAGILFFNRSFFVQSTPYILLLSFALLIWTQEEKNIAFYVFVITCIFAGIAVELTGVHTGLLFGKYTYGNVLGFKIAGVPPVIGINWFIIIFCCGISIHTFLSKISTKFTEEKGRRSVSIKALSVIVDGATLAVFFDWILEPVAVKLGFWKWHQDVIPLFNYLSWLVVSMLLLALFYKLPFYKSNKFAIHLLMIQAMFFLLLRTFL